MKDINQLKMTKFGNIEEKFLKQILIGKPRKKILKLLQYQILDLTMYPCIVQENFIIAESSWEKLKKEILSIYNGMSNASQLTELEKLVQKKNAKCGFPIKRPRLFPKIKTKKIKQSLKEPVNKNKQHKKRKPKKPIKKEILTIQGVNYKSSLIKLKGKKISTIHKIFNLDLFEFNYLLAGTNLKFKENDILSEDQFNSILDVLTYLKRKYDKTLRNKTKPGRSSKSQIKSNSMKQQIKRLNGGGKGRKKSSNHESKRKEIVQRNAIKTAGIRHISTGMRD